MLSDADTRKQYPAVRSPACIPSSKAQYGSEFIKLPPALTSNPTSTHLFTGLIPLPAKKCESGAANPHLKT